jgi:DNA-directed RNA polymerase subunit RPC12/RpoP
MKTTGKGIVCPNCGQARDFEQMSVGGYLFCDHCGYSARQDAFMKR